MFFCCGSSTPDISDELDYRMSIYKPPEYITNDMFGGDKPKIIFKDLDEDVGPTKPELTKPLISPTERTSNRIPVSSQTPTIPTETPESKHEKEEVRKEKMKENRKARIDPNNRNST
eukprot:TRINITY_DN1291_c0_g1_i1.p1 TRINITY_DN1291_c0_g1~~TRINITY_DN1291_c0_g1_i1.p1  ORF type:complete len:117 (+),score=27.18 TRINITY_DN1291_c0_g1_i1:90-440(+)